VDEVIVSAEGMNRELFYVAASRGRERVTVVTSDAAALRESVSCTSARQSATELARKALSRVERGVRRGFKAGCDLVRSARRPEARDLDPIARQIVPERRTHEHGASDGNPA
jgi:predicted RNA-binding protein with PIN domain